MQRTIENRLNEVHTRKQIIDTLLLNGFNVTEYQPSWLDYNASLRIVMVDQTSSYIRTATATIKEIDEDWQHSCKRTAKIVFTMTEAPIDGDLTTTPTELIRGTISHDISAADRRKFSVGEFITSARGIEMLQECRTTIQNRCATLDLRAHGDQLLKVAKSILRADKDQNGTLLESKQREQLLKWMAKHGSIGDNQLESWIEKGERLQKKPLAILDKQARDAALALRATDAQLKLLAERLNRKLGS